MQERRDRFVLAAAVFDHQRAHTEKMADVRDAASLAHLVAMSRLPNVTIQLVPYDAGGHSGLLGAFVIADRSAGGSIVFIEDVTGGRVSEDAATVAEVALRFDALRSEALPKNASRNQMESVAAKWKEQAP